MQYQATCTNVIDQYGGYVAQHLGDGVLAYFGYPSAHENDALRAVTAALEIIRVVPTVRADVSEASHEQLSVRIGIDSGLTVAGQIGAGAHRQSLALGVTPNVAARLQMLAPHNSIVISGDTYRLVSGAFECSALGPQRLGGVDLMIDAYQVLSERRHNSSKPAVGGHAAVPMIGRAAALARILGDFERAAKCEQRLVMVKGEAGIGKSRLLQAARDALEHEKHRWLGASCLPFYTNTAHYAAQMLIEELAGLSRLDQGEDRLAILRDFLGRVGCADTLPFVASGLGLDSVEAPLGLRLSPEATKDKTLEAFIAIFRAVATEQPLVLAVEDIHWADPSTVELLTLLTCRPSDACLLIILTSRSDSVVSWTPEVAPISLEPLTTSEGRELLRALAMEDEIPEPAMVEILRRSDGIPIYIEELAKEVVGRRAPGGGSSADHVSSPDGGHVTSIPIGVHSSLASRLDRLGDAKLVAQLAAAVGRTFDEHMIAQLIDRDPESVRADLYVLVEAGILTTIKGETASRADSGATQGAQRNEYQFRHALLQEVAYHSLLKRTRQIYHARIARVLEDDFADDVSHRPEFVAHHWSEAKCPEQALPHLVRAAQQSAQRYANIEAAAFYTRAVQSLEDIRRSGHDTSSQWCQRQSDLLESLGDTLALLVQRENAETVYRDAIAHLTDAPSLARARIVRKIGMVWQQQPDRALALYEEASRHLGVDQPNRDEEWRREWVSLHLARVRSFYWFNRADTMMELVAEVQRYMNDYATPLQRSEFFNLLTLAGVRRERYAVSDETVSHARDYVRAARDTGDLTETASACLTLGVILFCRGDCDESVAELQYALGLARQAGHPTFEIRCLTYLCSAHRRLGHVVDTLELCRELLRLATEKNMVEYAGMAHSNLTWAALAQGDLAAVDQHAQSALHDWEVFQVAYPFQWTARLPLLVLCAARSRVDLACEHARAMLKPDQHALPSALSGVLERIVARWEAGDENAAREALTEAIDTAHALHFLHLPAAAR
jgi:tetratricopeptide (TPR) repeat protein